MISSGLLERLRHHLRRDPSDREVGFLLSVGVRDPFVVYAAERERLRRMANAPFRTTKRAVLLAEVAAELLRLAQLRRPESGSMPIVSRIERAPMRAAAGDVRGPPEPDRSPPPASRPRGWLGRR